MTVIWQDVVLMITGFLLSAALIPAIRSTEKPARLTCLSTALLLAINAVCLITLGLWLAFISIMLTDIGWWILLFQRRTK